MLVSNVAELMSCIEEMLEVAERDEQFFVCKDDIDTPICKSYVAWGKLI